VGFVVFDFRPFCSPCLWCCHGEHVYVSTAEQDALGVDRFTGSPSEDGACEKLDRSTGLCSVHDRRPTECRLFPLDLLAVDGVVHWVVWRGACPAVPALPDGYADREADRWDATLDPAWVEAYVEHHRANQPAKYRPDMFTVLRPYMAGVIRGPTPA